MIEPVDPPGNHYQPPVNEANLRRQIEELLALERTFPPGQRTVYENGVEKVLGEKA